MDCTDLNTEAHDAVRDLQDARSAIQRTEWRRAEKALAEALARIRRLQREIHQKLEPRPVEAREALSVGKQHKAIPQKVWHEPLSTFGMHHSRG